ncbi:unnamed protein product, partial [Ascophyllum nodosum]
VQSSYGFRQQAIKEKVHRVLPRNALHSLTARRHQRSTTPQRSPCLGQQAIKEKVHRVLPRNALHS